MTDVQQAVPVAQIDVDLANKIGAAFDYNAGPEETWLEEMLARHRLDATQTRQAELVAVLQGFVDDLTESGRNTHGCLSFSHDRLTARIKSARAALNARGGA